MKRSPLNAVLRIFDTGGECVPVYYVDKILNELLFVGVWRPRRAAALAERCGELMDDGRWVVTLGGEHSITPGGVRAARERHPGLRVVQLCPAIVIGESRAGNNRGDTKVVNAPVNLFGRANEALRGLHGSWVDRSKGSMLAKMANVFPGDPFHRGHTCEGWLSCKLDQAGTAGCLT